MATQTSPEGKARSFGENIESDLASRFLRVVEVAAIASARTMGQGERKFSDQVATEAMRRPWTPSPCAAPSSSAKANAMKRPCSILARKSALNFLTGRKSPKSISPSIRSKALTSAPPARPDRLPCSRHPSVAACSTRPIATWIKLSSALRCKNAVDLDAPVADNLKNIAKRLERDVEDLVVIVLDRPRHEKLIADIRAAGARIRLIGDGDLSAGIAAAVIGTGVHAVMGSGGAPEGVITAAAIRCLNGFMLGRLVVKPDQEERLATYGHQRQEQNL